MNTSKRTSVSFFKRLNNWANKHEWMLVLITIMIFLRLPSLIEPFWYGDENIYLAIGQSLRHGATLYQDIIDYPNKPPMIYWLASMVGDVSRFRFVLLLWSIPGVIFFYRLAKNLTQNTTIGFFATLTFVYLTSTPILEGTIANGEIFFIVPTIMAISLLVDAEGTITASLKKHLLAGVLLGIGFLFKIHVILDIGAIGLVIYLLALWRERFTPLGWLFQKKLWLFISGLITPVVISLVWLGLQGVSPANLVTNAASSTGYTQAWSSSDWLLQTIGMGSLPARVVALGIILIVITLLVRKLSLSALIVTTWLACTLFAALLSARPYPHYLLQVVPPLVLVIGLFFRKRKFADYLLMTGLIVLVGASFVRFGFYLWPVKTYYQNTFAYVTGKIDQDEFYRRFDRRMPRNYELARIIQAYSQVDDRVYIWGTEPGVYVLSNRLPVGPLVTSFHVDDLDYYDETLSLIKSEQPELIIIMENEWRNFDELQTYLGEKYLLVEKVSDPDTSLDSSHFKALVYKRANFL